MQLHEKKHEKKYKEGTHEIPFKTRHTGMKNNKTSRDNSDREEFGRRDNAGIQKITEDVGKKFSSAGRKVCSKGVCS